MEIALDKGFEKDLNIGVIGTGNMGGAIIRGLTRSGRISPEHLLAYDVDAKKLEDIAKDVVGFRAAPGNRELAEFADVVIIAVKPDAVGSVLNDIYPAVDGNTLVVSIAAGIPISYIESRLRAGVRVVRVMPNTPAIVGAGSCVACAGSKASEGDLRIVRELFSSVGVVHILKEEHMDAVTGLSGSGPAYVFMVIEALADGGVRSGLPRDVSLDLAARTVFGSAKLLLESREHPAKLREMVTSPGGTTIAGLQVLEDRGVRGAFMTAVFAAALRSKELGKGSV